MSQNTVFIIFDKNTISRQNEFTVTNLVGLTQSMHTVDRLPSPCTVDFTE